MRYLLVDDQPESLEPITELLEDKSRGRLTINVVRPKSFKEMTACIEEFRPDGVLLDNRLEDSPDESGHTHGYRGTALAQQLRNLEVEPGTGAWAFPVVLLSLQRNIDRLVTPDRTVWDLFDLELDKNRPMDDHNAEQLVDLAIGYQALKALRGGDTPKTFQEAILGGDTVVKDADSRFLAYLDKPAMPCHVVAQIVIKGLLDRPGLLIDEPYLAARLGVDRQGSPDWPALLEHLEPIRYQGVFCSGWKRWWARYLEDWWHQLPGDPHDLRSLGASERVKFLSTALGLNGLVAATGRHPSAHDRFWMECAGEHIPLDPADAVRVWERTEAKPWQEARYMSWWEANAGAAGLKCHPMDEDRLHRLIRSQVRKVG